MILKQKKFYIINQLYKTLNLFNKEICLFIHVSNLSTSENNKFKLYCDLNNIKSTYIKVSLLKKLSKNNILINLSSGPTRLLFFSNFEMFLNFYTTVPLKNKIFPLAVFFYNKFFNYLFFYNYLNNLKCLLTPLSLNVSNTLKHLVVHLINFNKKIILSLSNSLINFIVFLPNYIKNIK